jgi:ABC-type multidrug transport system permease subunit
MILMAGATGNAGGDLARVPADAGQEMRDALGLDAIFAYALSWVFAALGLRVSDPEAAQGAGVPLMFLVVFTSCAFVPLSTMPGWLRVGPHQQVTALVNAEHALTLGGPAAHDVLISVAWSAGILLAFSALAGRTCQRMSR